MEHVFSVQSLRELKDVMPGSGGSVYVVVHTSLNDGGGGLFQWIAGSSDPSDDGIVVAGSGDPPGRWHRIESQPINVRWFGAVGDATDATEAIQRAMDAQGTEGPSTFLRERTKSASPCGSIRERR
jgi:hypothetical protein